MSDEVLIPYRNPRDYVAPTETYIIQEGQTVVLSHLLIEGELLVEPDGHLFVVN